MRLLKLAISLVIWFMVSCKPVHASELHRLVEKTGMSEELQLFRERVGETEFLRQVFARDRQGYLPIHRAALAGNIIATSDLIRFAPSMLDVRMGRYPKSTPLHCAIFKGRVGVIETLLRSGADPSIRDLNERRAEDLGRYLQRAIGMRQRDRRRYDGIKSGLLLLERFQYPSRYHPEKKPLSRPATPERMEFRMIWEGRELSFLAPVAFRDEDTRVWDFALFPAMAHWLPEELPREDMTSEALPY